MNAQTPFSFVSLNINGTKDKDLLISELLENDIVFLQEHLLSKVNVDSLKRSRTHYTFLRAAQKNPWQTIRRSGHLFQTQDSADIIAKRR